MEIVRTVSLIGVYANGILSSGTPFVITMSGHPLPTTITLDSSAGGRLIELSTDGGTNYFTPTYDANTTNMINVAVTAPVTNVRVTGQANDTWSIR